MRQATITSAAFGFRADRAVVVGCADAVLRSLRSLYLLAKRLRTKAMAIPTLLMEMLEPTPQPVLCLTALGTLGNYQSGSIAGAGRHWQRSPGHSISAVR